MIGDRIGGGFKQNMLYIYNCLKSQTIKVWMQVMWKNSTKRVFVGNGSVTVSNVLGGRKWEIKGLV